MGELQRRELQVTFAPQNDKRWLAFVDREHPTLFQTPRWCDLISAEYGFSTHVALALEGSDVVCGLPYAEVEDFRGRRRIAFAFSDFCEPLGDQAAWPRIEIALCADKMPWQIRSRAVPSEPVDQIEQPGVQQSISLPATMAEAAMKFHQKQRVNTSRFERAGGSLSKLTDQSFVEPFYNLFTTLRKRKFRLLPQSREFFERVVAAYFPDRGFGLLAKLGDQVVAAMILLSEGNTLYVKYSASDPGILKLRPNNYLFQNAIEQAVNAGYRHLDLGISVEEGLQRFKEHLGATSTPYYAARYLQAPKTAAVIQVENCLRNLTHILTEDEVPLSAAASAGSELYRYFV